MRLENIELPLKGHGDITFGCIGPSAALQRSGDGNTRLRSVAARVSPSSHCWCVLIRLLAMQWSRTSTADEINGQPVAQALTPSTTAFADTVPPCC